VFNSRCNRRHGDSTDTPADHHGREKQARSYSSQPQITWELTDQVSDIEGRDAGTPDGIAHTEVILEASKTCVGHIDTIKVASFGVRIDAIQPLVLLQNILE